MNDLISRQAAIDALAKFVPYAICDASTKSYTNGLKDAYNLICQLPSAQPEIDKDFGECEDDLISRQAAIEAVIKRDANCGIDSAKVLKDLPSAQPELIRCKDCRFATLTYDGDCKYCQYLEGEFGLTDAVYFDGNDYCSHAERRTDG